MWRSRFTLGAFRVSQPLWAGGKAKPGWTVPPDQMFHPQIPDRHFYGDHWFYHGFTLFLRGVRPYLEKIGRDTIKTAWYLGHDCLYFPLQQFVSAHNPDVRYLAIMSISALVVYWDVGHRLYYEPPRALQNLRNAVSLAEADRLDKEGFWDSNSETQEKKIQKYNMEHQRLNALWEEAITDATETRSFEVLCSYLAPKEVTPHPVDKMPLRLNMMPYGDSNTDTITFSTPKTEMVYSTNANSQHGPQVFGDYVDRVDPKPPNLRHARSFFMEAYTAPTK
ncbi:unnamed protein product [Vitrella brassicaformis CCMP3155]|uniref:Uncharacterized protein n=2 Tax=Vitrella brassicaformis TaxID=1169539 RepID=A0A0G4EWQ9_VITBC|nr:unnamed protein product [Vitrella brassicaformis CCMP3155]|mmetsp:Transcript_41335/g.103157  ORF Transcript_41335/g.103157 Transcript_41335/m.103157 type:complete len:279 (+) Transcript_41335:79-915(+)|eukprot:CEM02699.1 unnamed protein product [Vitrella brassicaformis CCMP3155]